MANLTYSTTLPQRKALIKSQQLKTLFTDIRTFANTFVPSVSGGAQYQSLLVNSGLNGFDLGHVLRSDGAVSLTGTGSLASQDLLVYDGSNFTRLAKGANQSISYIDGSGNLAYLPVGSNGQGLQVSGGVLTWASVASNPTPSIINSSSTLVANSFNIVDPSAGSITLDLPASPATTLKPIFLVPDENSWDTDNWTLDGNGTNIIQVNDDGSKETAAATITMDADIPVAIYFAGTNYIMVRF